MNINNSQNIIIQKEKQNISKYTGLLYSRIFLLFCLFVLLAVLPSAPFYFFVFLLLCPWIFSNIATSRHKSQTLLLSFGAKSFYYTPINLSVEKSIGYCIVLLLVIWQIVFPPTEAAFPILRLVPGFLLLLYLIFRITATAIARRMIHRIYTKLLLLD